MKPVHAGIISGFAGGVFTLLFIFFLGQTASWGKKDSNLSVTKFDLEQNTKVKAKKPVEKEQIKKASQAKKTSSMKPLMTAGLSGQSFGLELDYYGLGGADGSLFGSGDNVTMNEDSVDELPQRIQGSPIEFPRIAREKNIKGHVLLNILVDRDGKVSDVKLVEAVPPGFFETVAMNGVKDWSFDPAKYKGKPVNTWVMQKIRFEAN